MNTFLLIVSIVVINLGCSPIAGDLIPNLKDDKKTSGTDQPADDDGSTDGTATDSGDESQSEEKFTADIPVEVTGAFATSIKRDNFDNMTAKSGFKLVGINVYQTKTFQKVDDPVMILKLSINTGTTTLTFKPIKIGTKVDDICHAVFEVPQDLEFGLNDITVKVSISESANFVLGASLDTGEKSADDPGSSPSSNAKMPLENVTEHIIFVTAKTYTPGKDFDSIKIANALCNIEASEKPELQGFWWSAVLSDETWMLGDRLRLRGPIKNISGTVLLDLVDVLSGMSLPANTLQAADGTFVSESQTDLVFTGTTKQGTIGDTCSSWKSSVGKATVGLASSSDDWLMSTVVNCNEPRRLYCINSKIRTN